MNVLIQKWSALRILAMLAISAVLCLPASATPIVIDTFQTVQAVQIYPAGGKNATYTGQSKVTLAGEAFGGHRTVSVWRKPSSPIDGMSLSTGRGLADFAQSDNTRGRGRIQYNGASNLPVPSGTSTNRKYGAPSGILPAAQAVNFNLPGYGLILQAKADNTGIPITFTFYGSSAARYVDYTAYVGQTLNVVGQYTPSGYNTYFVPFNRFTAHGSGATLAGVLSGVRAITVDIDGLGAVRSGTDVTFRYFASGSVTDAVPEPGTMGLIGGSLLGLSIFLRRRRAV